MVESNCVLVWQAVFAVKMCHCSSRWCAVVQCFNELAGSSKEKEKHPESSWASGQPLHLAASAVIIGRASSPRGQERSDRIDLPFNSRALGRPLLPPTDQVKTQEKRALEQAKLEYQQGRLHADSFL